MVESSGFLNGLDVEYESKEEIKMTTRFLS
jgi:hypothetical protein